MKVIFKKIFSVAGNLFRHTPLAKIDILNQVHGQLSVWLHGSDTVDIGPFVVKFDRRDRIIAKKLILYKEFEKEEIELLCSLIKPGSHVLDIGANIGLHSLYLSRAVGAQGRVISIEPDPDNFKILTYNIKTNKCENVTILQYALGDESGEVDLFQNDTNRGNLSLADLAETKRSIKVQKRRGDEVLADLEISPELAKIDVEGYEPFVISGLGRYKPDNIMFEFYVPYLERFGVDPEVFLNSLNSEGYSLRLIDSHGETLEKTPSELTELSRKAWKEFMILASR